MGLIVPSGMLIGEEDALPFLVSSGLCRERDLRCVGFEVAVQPVREDAEIVVAGEFCREWLDGHLLVNLCARAACKMLRVILRRSVGFLFIFRGFLLFFMSKEMHVAE